MTDQQYDFLSGFSDKSNIRGMQLFNGTPQRDGTCVGDGIRSLGTTDATKKRQASARHRNKHNLAVELDMC
jgi:hypothetical protein